MSDFVLIGFAALFLWYLLALSSLLDRPLGWVRDRANPLIGCPWCAGFWITGAISLCVGYDFLTHLAAAAIVGVVGGYAGE